MPVNGRDASTLTAILAGAALVAGLVAWWAANPSGRAPAVLPHGPGQRAPQAEAAPAGGVSVVTATRDVRSPLRIGRWRLLCDNSAGTATVRRCRAETRIFPQGGSAAGTVLEIRADAAGALALFIIGSGAAQVRSDVALSVGPRLFRPDRLACSAKKCIHKLVLSPDLVDKFSPHGKAVLTLFLPGGVVSRAVVQTADMVEVISKLKN